MSTIICSYEGCMVRRFPCSSIAFFALPNDARRQQWIVNSGNKDLRKLSPKRIRLFCENHFLASDIRSQFNRKTLRRSAVPIPYNPRGGNETKATTHDKFNFIEKVAMEQDLVQHEDSEEPLEEADLSADTKYMGINDSDCGIDGDVGLKENSDGYGSNLVEECGSEEESIIEELPIQGFVLTDPDSPGVEVSRTDGLDDDRHFALSLVGYFQRLSHQKKITAKLKILSYLTALELDENVDLQ